MRIFAGIRERCYRLSRRQHFAARALFARKQKQFKSQRDVSSSGRMRAKNCTSAAEIAGTLADVLLRRRARADASHGDEIFRACGLAIVDLISARIGSTAAARFSTASVAAQCKGAGIYIYTPDYD